MSDPTEPLDLYRFFHPKTIALIGATDDKRRAGYALFRKVVDRGKREGTVVYPVNPRLQELDGITCYPTLAEVPGEVDVAVIMIGDAEKGLRDAVAKGAKFAIVFTAGFAEMGEEGAAKEAELAAIAREGGVRLFGPNTNLNAFESFPETDERKLALVTQSGHQGRPIAQGTELGIGVAYWAPTGNEADLEFADFVEFFADQPEVAVIAAYIEGFKSIPRLRQAADRAMAAGKPIVLVKVGRSEPGRRMALAHTGHMTGADAVHDAFFDQYGIIRVEDLDELLDTSALFTRTLEPEGNGIGIYAISGGTGALMADLAGHAGLPLPTLTEETQAQLRELIPEYLTVANPVDNGAQTVKSGMNKRLMDITLADPNVGILVCPITGVLPSMSKIVTTDIVECYLEASKPVIVIWGSPVVDDEGYRILVEGNVPMFRSFKACATGLRRYLGYWEKRRTHEVRTVSPPSVPAGIADLLAGEGPLSEAESARVVAEYGIPVAKGELVTSADAAAAAAERIGYPVVVKACGRAILHKSDADLVRVGVADEAGVREAFAALDAGGRTAGGEDGYEGVLIQELVQGGVEVIVGVSDDPQFGPVVLFGLGGVFTEVVKDVALRVAPLTERDAHEMVRGIKAFPLLDGARGRLKADVAALEGLILDVSRMAMDLRDRVTELDLNPVRVMPEGVGVVALDALVVRKEVRP
ncbi:MAG: acetate--CoA ligase family protein [Actinomycetota bacterium]